MQILEDTIKKKGIIINEHVLKVDSFLNHQIDPNLIDQIALAFKDYFKHKKVDKIITIESSGIAPALLLGLHLQVPVVFMKKAIPNTLHEGVYQTEVFSFTKQKSYLLNISKQYIHKNEHIIFVDDFLASGEACLGALTLLQEAGAHIEGIGIVIEKSFQSGAQKIKDLGFDLCSLAKIKTMSKNYIEFIS